jgi:hypothetical protein
MGTFTDPLVEPYIFLRRMEIGLWSYPHWTLVPFSQGLKRDMNNSVKGDVHINPVRCSQGRQGWMHEQLTVITTEIRAGTPSSMASILVERNIR